MSPRGGSSAQHPSPPQDPLAELDQLADVLPALWVEVTAQRHVGGLAGLATALLQDRHVLLVPGVGEGAAELDQQRLQPDSKLERGLAPAAAVEVGTRPQDEGLRGVDPLASPEYGRDALLRAQVLIPAPSHAAAHVDSPRHLEASVGDLVAAAVADSY